MEAHGRADTNAACAFDRAAARAHLFRHCGGHFDSCASPQRRCADLDGGPGATATTHEAAARRCVGSAHDAWLDWPASHSFRSACPTEICVASDSFASLRSLDLQSPDGSSRAWCEEEAGSETGAAARSPAIDADFQRGRAQLAAARAVCLPDIAELQPVAVRPAPRSHFEDFFGWRTAEQSQAGRSGEAACPDGSPATPRARCLRNPLFGAKVPYDAPSDARLQAVLVMLTSSRCAEPGARAQVAALQAGQANASLQGPRNPLPRAPRHAVGLDRVEGDDSRSPTPFPITLPSWG